MEAAASHGGIGDALTGAEQEALRQILHQVAQPLTVLAAVLDALYEPCSPGEQEASLQLARQECERAIAAVQHLQGLRKKVCR